MSQAAGATSGDKERSAIARRAGVVGLGTLASRVLGLGREMCIAALFTTATTDAFWIAFTIPNTFRSLLAEGGIASTVVPVLTAVKEREGNEAAISFFAKARGLSLLALTATTVLGMLFAPALVDLYASGYQARAGETELTVLLTRWCFPYLLLIGSAAMGAAALNANKSFWVAAFAPGLLNVAFIAAAVVLPPMLGPWGQPAGLALAVGALVGGVLQVAAQIPALRAIGYGGFPSFDFRDPHVREAARRVAPITLGAGIYFVDLIVCRRWLSGLGEGAQSYFAFAQRLCDFPQGIVVMAIQTAALPSLSAIAARGDDAELGKTFAYGMRLSLFVAIPVTAAFVFLSEPIVVAAFQRGHFDAPKAHETARSLVAQGSGVWAMAAVRQLVPVFFARGETRLPVIVSALDLGALIVLAWVLRGPLGHVGIAWAVTGSSIVQMLLLWIVLARRVRPMPHREIVLSIARTAAASVAGGTLGAWVAREIAPFAGAGTVGRVLPGVVGGAAFGLVFLIVAFALKSDELAVIVGGLSRRLRRRAAHPS